MFFFVSQGMHMMSLLRDARRGVVDEALLERIRKDPYKAFNLKESVGVRPSVLRYVLPLDDEFLKRMVRALKLSQAVGLRMGREWKPRQANAILTKDASDDHWATYEQLEPFNDACTKWCTATYFPDAFSRVNMVANVLRLYDRLRDVSGGLRFRIVFKGGVMIRLVLLEFFQNLPPSARRAVREHMERALSMSDFDFEIVPENHAPSADHVHRFFTLDYAVLLWLQREMEREVSRPPQDSGLLYLRWDAAEQEEELRSRLQAVADAVTDPTSPFRGARIDRVVLGDGTRSQVFFPKATGPRAVRPFLPGVETTYLTARTQVRASGSHGLPGARCGRRPCGLRRRTILRDAQQLHR